MQDKPYILAIDDDRFYLNEVELELQGKARYRGFLGPNAFEDDVTEEDINSADAILVDYDFGRGNAVQSTLASEIRNVFGYKGKLILWTVAPAFPDGDKEKIDRDYDLVIRKGDFCWDKLVEALSKKEVITVPS